MRVNHISPLIILAIMIAVFVPENIDAQVRTKKKVVPSRAYGTFQGTQDSYYLNAGGLRFPVPPSFWELNIRQAKIKLSQTGGDESDVYAGTYKILEIQGDSVGTLKCALRLTGKGDAYEAILEFHLDSQGNYFWIKRPGSEGEPPVTLQQILN